MSDIALQELGGCPVCLTFSVKVDKPSDGILWFRCPRCGNFGLSPLIEPTVRALEDEDRAKLSYALRLRQRQDERPVVHRGGLEPLLASTVLPGARELADNLLVWAGTEVGSSFEAFASELANDLAGIVGARDGDAVAWAAGVLMSMDFVRDDSGGGTIRVRLTALGWDRFHELQRFAAEPSAAFMAMPYGREDLERAFVDCFVPAVERAGFQLRRLDRHPKAGSIDNRLRVEIRKARFLIADLTGGNQGAYFEAGFAEGLGKPVFYTCEAEYFREHKTHFDTNHLHTVLWHLGRIEEAQDELTAAIRNTLPAEAKLTDEGQA